jgi:type VI secretion system secreted protein VgrG
MGVVMVENLPAAHVNCVIVCSGATSAGPAHPPLPVPPAPPPPIILGSATVLIHNMPAARWTPSGDVGACGVFLGDPKLVATRTVFIGGPTSPAPPAGIPALPSGPVPTTYGSAIVLDGDEEFRRKTIQALNEMALTPTGRALLASLEASDQTITIKPSTGGNGASPSDGSKAQRRPDGTPGDGCGSTVRFNPDRTVVGDGSEDWHRRPPGVGLAHELIHANHSAHGTNDFTPAGEDMAVGVAPYDTDPFTENRIRSEWYPPQPQRPSY